jgi:sodium/bile acid cotransporter 7
MPNWLTRLKPDPYILALLGTVAAASFLPARGEAASVLAIVAKVVVALLFFLHGARLSREAMLAGLTHWRLHLLVLAITFALFPLLGLGISLTHALPATLMLGVMFLCCLPSTVQSSIAFTSIAHGNVAAAVCAASASNILGMFLTPLLVGVLMHTQGGGFSPQTLWSILLQLFVPFLAGQLVRPFVMTWIDKTRRVLALTDRGSVLVVVYSAFSEAVVQGLWTRVSVGQLIVVAMIALVLLVVVLAFTMLVARRLGFETEDEITIVFCGSKKSLVTGAPMAAILFPPATAGVMILPLMLYHQMQLIACAFIAKRYAQRLQTPETPG